MKDKHTAILLILACTIFTAVGQVLWKLGLNKTGFGIMILVNPIIISGFVLYAIGAIFMITSFKKGNLSLVHPFVALSFVWISIIAFFYLKEPFNLLKIISIVLIIAGSALIFKGDSK